MTNTPEDRDRIRSKFRPFQREATYPTGWAGNLTFAAIRDALTPNLNRLMRYYRYIEADIPDMMAHGFMRLWEQLTIQPDLLADKDHGGALKWVLYRSGLSLYRKFYRREMYLEDLATRSGDPDEFIIEGYEGRHYRDHSDYSQQIDLRIDIEWAVQQLAAKYEHSLAHLAALYYITTSVKPDDAAALAGRGGTKQSWWITSVVKPVREELCALLGLFRREKITWQQKHDAGETAPLAQLIERFQTDGNKRMVATIESMGRCEPVKALVERLNVPKTTVHHLRLVAHKELNQAYGRRV